MSDDSTNSQAGRAGHFTPVSSEDDAYSTFSPKPLPPGGIQQWAAKDSNLQP